MPRMLPPAEVVRKYVDDTFDVNTPIMVLRWTDPAACERIWELPEGLSVVGPPPRHFALLVRRAAGDGYAVRLMWDRTQLSWPGLSRLDLLGSCLGALLSSLGLDLWSLLEQSGPALRLRPRAA